MRAAHPLERAGRVAGVFVRTCGTPVEVEKGEAERGKYQHPERYDPPEGKGMHYRPDARDDARKQPDESAAQTQAGKQPGEFRMCNRASID